MNSMDKVVDRMLHGELRERGEAHNGTPRTCSVSGKKAQTWWPGPEIAT